MSGPDGVTGDFSVDELIGLPDDAQAEKIADHYASISQEYKPVLADDFPEYAKPSNIAPPRVSRSKVEKLIKSMNKKSAGVPGDVPMRIIAEFSYEFSKPLAHLINHCFSQGTYPKLWKMEFVTPVPKVFPPEKIKDLRKISGLMNFSKITDKVIAEYISEDIKVILGMIDWSQAFDRQSHKLGIQSFIDNGVRPSLIPILINFFQDREMKVKWKGLLSKSQALPGGGPQGGIPEELRNT